MDGHGTSGASALRESTIRRPLLSSARLRVLRASAVRLGCGHAEKDCRSRRPRQPSRTHGMSTCGPGAILAPPPSPPEVPMFRQSFSCLVLLSSLTSLVAAQRARPVGPGGTLAVVQTIPAAISVAPVTTAITVVFDRPVAQNSVDKDSFRVFGRQSGPARGHFSFLNGGQKVVFTPDELFAAGEVVWVNLAHSIHALDASRLRAAGHAFQFGTAVVASSATFAQYDVLSNTTGPQTRIYGASATDLNHDGYPDLTTVNEVSADLRVFLNLAD